MIFFLRIIITIIVCIIFTALPVYAGSTALSESKFSIKGEPEAIVSKTLTISNLSNQAQNYRFYPDEAGEEARQRISVVPSEFQLLPHQSLAVAMRFRAENKDWHTYLNLVAINTNDTQKDFQVSNGIKIPVNFSVSLVPSMFSTKSSLLPSIIVYGVDFGLLLVVCWLYYKRRFGRRISL